jgi:hypothetical protein
MIGLRGNSHAVSSSKRPPDASIDCIRRPRATAVIEGVHSFFMGAIHFSQRRISS